MKRGKSYGSAPDQNVGKGDGERNFRHFEQLFKNREKWQNEKYFHKKLKI